MYANIPNNPPDCVSRGCRAANCPFEEFHNSYNIKCFHPAQDFRLRDPTPLSDLPSNEPDEGQEYFLNFGYQGTLDLPANINGRLFKLPPVSLTTQREESEREGVVNRCSSIEDEYSCFDGCMCTQIIDIPYDKTIRFVLTSIGEQTHPIHLHGHSFWVVASGYGQYDLATGFIERSTNALTCLKNCSNLMVRSYYTHYASLAVLVYLTKRALDRTCNCIGYGTRLDNILQHGTKYSTIQLISDT